MAWDVELPESLPLGDPAFDPQLAEHAVSSFATNAGLTLHVTKKAGRNVHHIIEATFKGLARSLRDAVRVDAPGAVPSTKGCCEAEGPGRRRRLRDRQPALGTQGTRSSGGRCPI